MEILRENEIPNVSNQNMLHTCLELSKKEQIKNYIQIQLWIWRGNTKGYLLLFVLFCFFNSLALLRGLPTSSQINPTWRLILNYKMLCLILACFQPVVLKLSQLFFASELLSVYILSIYLSIFYLTISRFLYTPLQFLLYSWVSGPWFFLFSFCAQISVFPDFSFYL